MANCSNLYYLSTIACALSDCLSDGELSVLSADLVVLSDMLANILVRSEQCDSENANKISENSPKTIAEK